MRETIHEILLQEQAAELEQREREKKLAESEEQVQSAMESQPGANEGELMCSAILKSGKRQGQICGATCKGESETCHRHGG